MNKFRTNLLSVIFILLRPFLRNCVSQRDLYNDDYFPHVIRKFPVRKDELTNEPVSRGRIELVGGLTGEFSLRNPRKSKNPQRIHINDLMRVLQCPKREPTIDASRGTVGLLKLIKPSRKTIEHICANIESGCEPYYKCKELIAKYKKGEYPTGHGHNGNSNRNLIRVIGDDLYLDWPWGRSRLANDPYPSMTILIFQLLDRAFGFPNSVFIVAAEQSFFDWNVPFPAFSNSPSFKSSDIPWPWIESWRTEVALHRKVLDEGNGKRSNFSGESYHKHFTRQREWSERIPKALYLGEMIVCLFRVDSLSLALTLNHATAHPPNSVRPSTA